MSAAKTISLWGKLVLFGLFVHVFLCLGPLAKEARVVLRELPLLWGAGNEERRQTLLGGVPDSIEDHEFIARCDREIPPDADVLIKTNLPTNIYTLNYYLYPRRTGESKETLREGYWTVHYYTPKARGLNDIKGPGENGESD